LGRKVRRVALFDQGRLRPKEVVFPQFAHFAISYILSKQPGFPVKITDPANIYADFTQISYNRFLHC
jgi:hypothetical protein